MSALLTKAFEKWIAKCIAGNLPARPDAIVFALMNRDPSPEDNIIPPEKITYTVNKLTYGQLTPNSIVCSGAVTEDAEFSYDWICLVHQASGTLCGVIKTLVRHKHAGETLLRNFAVIYSGMAQAAQITTPPQSWQLDISPELRKMLKASNCLSEIAEDGEWAQRRARENLGIKGASGMEAQSGRYDRTKNTLAVTGMFGFGYEPDPDDVISLASEDSFLKWVRKVRPGRYCLHCWNISIPALRNFSGHVDVIWTNPSSDTATAEESAKGLLFCRNNNANPAVFYLTYTSKYQPGEGSTPGKYVWGIDDAVSLVTDGDALSKLLSATSGGASWFNYKYPQVGVPVLAAYQGETTGAREIKIGLGDVVPGSRLAPVNITGGFSESGAYESTPGVSIAGINTYNFPGRYQALSGTRGSYSANAVIGLFVRIQ